MKNADDDNDDICDSRIQNREMLFIVHEKFYGKLLLNWAKII